MDERLAALVERARNHVMTPEERFEQRVSFVYGQQEHSSGNARSKDEIRKMLAASIGHPHAAASVPDREAVARAVLVGMWGEQLAEVYLRNGDTRKRDAYNAADAVIALMGG